VIMSASKVQCPTTPLAWQVSNVVSKFKSRDWKLEIRSRIFTPPLMGGDKGEGGNISPSPRLPFKVFQQRQASSPTRGEEE